MSRRWSPILVLVAAGVAWLAWRFLPREWLAGCCGGGGLQRGGDAAPPRADLADEGTATGRGAGTAAETASAATTADPARPILCVAVTRRGRRCTREVEPGSIHCWQHGGG